jgi:hypothetical protein
MAVSQVTRDEINKIFNATKDMKSREEMLPHIESFRNWIMGKYPDAKTRGSQLSGGEFYKKFRTIPLIPGENAENVAKHDAEGNIKGYELKHYVVIDCGLSAKDWDDRNNSSKVTERLESGTEIDPDIYLDVTEKLLESSDVDEVAVGLIAATGRRPVEITVRGKLAKIDNEAYHMMFEGQVKKRGEKPVFRIAGLFPVEYLIGRLAWFRKQPETKELISAVSRETADIEKQNTLYENSRGNIYRRIAREYFGGKLELREGQENNDCKGLRAAYLALATERDCIGSIGQKMLHAAKLAGHYVTEEKVKDDELRNLITTLGYVDYYCIKPIEFRAEPVKEPRLSSIKGDIDDMEWFRDLQRKLGHKNQAQTFKYLRTMYENQQNSPSNADVAGLSFEKLLERKSSDVTEEKLRRIFVAIKEHNAEQTENGERLAISNMVLRELSGSHPEIVGKWVGLHKDEIISHHSMYGIAGKDLTSPITYHNRFLGEGKKNEIIGKIRTRLVAL